MSFTIIAIVVAALCVAASARRLGFAAQATALDAGVLLSAVKAAPEMWPSIRGEIERDPAAEWERELVVALDSKEPALVNEQLGDLDYISQRWARVPRVCASVASSSGFLLAALVMRDALAADQIDVDSAISHAIGAVVVGLCGTAFCVAAHLKARTLVKERLVMTDKLIDRLESLAK
jgi:hypothetical protein